MRTIASKQSDAATAREFSPVAAQLGIVLALASLWLCSCRTLVPAPPAVLAAPGVSSVALADTDKDDEAANPFGDDPAGDDSAMDNADAPADEAGMSDSAAPADDAAMPDAAEAREPSGEDAASDQEKPAVPGENAQPPAASAPEVPGRGRTRIRLVNPGPSPASNKAVDHFRGALPIVPMAPLPAPIPQGIVTPWRPPGIAGPWPADEYLWDGGEKYPVIVDENLDIKGLALEDTVVHYDTIDGRTIVEPSNRVVIYSPRFGAVRQVTSAMGSHQDQGLVQADRPQGPNLAAEHQLASTALQPVQPVGEIGTKQPSIEKGQQIPLQPFSRLRAAEMSDRLLPFEDWEIVRNGIFAQSEQVEVHQRVEAAIAWTADQAVQVIIDKQYASVETGDQRAQATYMVETPNHPRLRVIKLASRQTARPGECVDFTIRFDNIGDQVIGNVTLVDNLTTRLEYVDGSAESSLAADFFTDPNEGDSLLLRWQFVEPLPAGRGGVVRFRCRVR